MGLQGRQGCAAIFWKVLVTGIFAVGVRMVFAEIGMGVGERWLGVQVVHVFYLQGVATWSLAYIQWQSW